MNTIKLRNSFFALLVVLIIIIIIWIDAVLNLDVAATEAHYLLFPLYHILYIIAEVERKLIPTIKEVLPYRKNVYLKFSHV